MKDFQEAVKFYTPPEEKNIEMVNPLTLKEVMELAEYSHITKFKKELLPKSAGMSIRIYSNLLDK